MLRSDNSFTLEFESWITGVCSSYVVSLCDFAYYVVDNSHGPDKLNIRHLKHIGPLELAFLTSMFKTALNKNIVPNTWKLANIVQNPTKTQTRAPHTGPYPSSQ